MKGSFILRFAIGIVVLAGYAPAARAASVIITGTSAGPTPFISQIHLTVSPANVLVEIRFIVRTKPLSVTRPISARYSAAYLSSRGFLDTETGGVTLPVFGLYANYDNTVELIFGFTEGDSSRNTVTVSTPVFNDPSGGIYLNPTVVQPRSARLDLSYDYFMLKAVTASISPVIVDTDGEVRWIGTAGLNSVPAIFSNNSILVSSGTAIIRMELDGAFNVLADYAGIGVTWTGHHNYDPGKQGILVEVDTTEGYESTIIEIDPSGGVLKTWRLADIISEAMIAGGDDPSAFVRAPDDWFHNNAATYRRLDDSLIVSSRENFVIALDYETGAIKWILGDPTKAWYEYPSLRKYALTLEGTTLPPVGQHALSMARNGDLLLFDNGTGSLAHTPAGETRSYSASRRYRINTRNTTATETWNYISAPSVYSAFCSSIYEDGLKNYLIDYSATGDVIGLNAEEAVVFHYRYSPGCATSWNAIPVHLENVVYQ